MAFTQLISPNLNVRVQPGWCLGYVSQVLGINSSAYWTAWSAWAATAHKHGPDVPLPNVPVLVWFDHWGDYGDGWGRYGHVAYNIPGVGIYSSPTGRLGAPASFQVYQTIAQVEQAYASTYVGWSEDLAGVRFAAPNIVAPEPEPHQEEDMSKPLIAQKLDGGPLNTLGVLIEPDGTVTALDIGQWEFWRDRVGCVPVECRNPGHWEYLMGVMAKRRYRFGVTITSTDVSKIAAAVKTQIADAKTPVSTAQVASVLQLDENAPA